MAGNQSTLPVCLSSHELTDRQILSHLHNINDKTITFYALKVGHRCNGDKAYSFTHAECDLRTIRCKDIPSLKLDSLEDPVAISFHKIFQPGLDLLEGLKEGNTNIGTSETETHIGRSLKVLDDFFLKKEQHYASLGKILTKDFSETDIAVVIAEHLLSKLSPGQSYIIDNNSRKKGKCRCGCNANVSFGNTGIGNENVWHGFIDIILSSHDGIPCPEPSAAAVKCFDESTIPAEKRKYCDENFDKFAGDGVDSKRPKLYSDNEFNPLLETMDKAACSRDCADNVEGSPGGKTIAEVKLTLKDDVENQSISQAIVFSLLQKQRHPQFLRFLVPNILICNKYFRIIMYDAENDILLRSSDCQLLSASNYISYQSITILWMVLHYRVFCSGISSDSLKVKLIELESGFRKEMHDCWDLYSGHLKSCVRGFPHVRKLDVPDEHTTCVYNI